MSSIKNIVSILRPVVERSPYAASVYRAIRDELDGRSAALATKWGFLLSGNQSMADGSFEPEETRLVRKILFDVDVLINVGANVGYYCCHALSMGKLVVAFEPMRRNLQHLYRNVIINGWSDIEIFPVALSDHAGLIEIYGGNTGASVVKGWAGTSEEYVTLVPSMRMDSVLGDRLRGKRVMIIVDVEGAEHMVLAGASKILENDPRPTWLIEISATENQPHGVAVNPRLVETFEMFFSRGYMAFTANQALRIVSLEDVKLAAERGEPVCGTHNFVFRPAS